MKELSQIVRAYDQAFLDNKKCVLATVVNLQGSSYRRPGARMLVSEDGMITGAISGGCLEGDALRKALLCLTDQSPRLITYDTSYEDDMQVGIQLGCEGVIQVLFEYIHPTKPYNPIELIRQALHHRGASVLITLFNHGLAKVHPGTILLSIDLAAPFIGEGFTSFSSELIAQAQEVTTQKKSHIHSYHSDTFTADVLFAYIQQPVSLVVIGAGNDAIPLMELANALGWDVRIVDGRKTHANVNRFAAACQIVVGKPGDVINSLPVHPRTCFVLLTHNYLYDLEMLQALLPLAIPYIGILGPRKKWNKMMDDLQLRGISLPEEVRSKIFCPTGLDIGTETADEIAVSIIAEIQAVLSGKSGNSLREKIGLIHS